jgi:K+-transporting ATPase c subunit
MISIVLALAVARIACTIVYPVVVTHPTVEFVVTTTANGSLVEFN